MECDQLPGNGKLRSGHLEIEAILPLLLGEVLSLKRKTASYDVITSADEVVFCITTHILTMWVSPIPQRSARVDTCAK